MSQSPSEPLVSSVIIDDYDAEDPVTERYPSSHAILSLIRTSSACGYDDADDCTSVSRMPPTPPPPPERAQALAAVLATVLLVAFAAAWSPSLAVYASLLTGGALAHWAHRRLP